ncbi:MAG: mannose-1-phosphate guanylyltransferase [Woeseia sp.]|nr:mannose-1-phosphate guanylyltransferase [Woeseia sp.]|tara:strand:- start:2200 stop:2859 length:660 start_codon:yes stop_codon:yes gene_type:complete
MKAMILAAGRGERLKPITDSIPKALIEIRGKTLLERHLIRLYDAGIRDVIINTGWQGKKIRDKLSSGFKFGLNIEFSDEGDNILETGGGILNALNMLGEKFLVINADIFTDMPIPNLHLSAGILGHVILVPSPVYHEHGDFDLIDGLIKNTNSQNLKFSGVAQYRSSIFDGCNHGKFSMTPLLRKYASKGLIKGTIYKGFWADVGTPERLDALKSMKQS